LLDLLLTHIGALLDLWYSYFPFDINDNFVQQILEEGRNLSSWYLPYAESGGEFVYIENTMYKRVVYKVEADMIHK
jgi:hypothetical protein